MPPQDSIDRFIALPRDKQLSALGKLSPADQDAVLGQVKQRRGTKAAAPAPSTPQLEAGKRLPAISGLEMRAARPDQERNLPAEGSVEQRFGPGGGGYVEDARQHALDWMDRNAPIVMGTIGGVSGGVPGAILGGVVGGVAQHPPAPGAGPMQVLKETGIPAAEQGLTQGAYEIGGKMFGKLAGKLAAPLGEKLAPRIAPYLTKYPMLKGLLGIAEEKTAPKAAQYLTRAAASKEAAGQVVEEIGHTLEDIEHEITQLPVEKRTVGGFLSAVNSRKSAMNLEYETALKPVAKAQTTPLGVAQKILGLIQPYMSQPEYKVEAEAIEAEAKTFEKPWTFEQLDSLRTKLGADLSKHKAKESVARYTAEKGSVSLAIDNAILDGLRDTVYPEMDRVAGKATGYFETMKQHQSSLITLQRVLNKRVKDLSGAQAVSEATSRFSSENVSIYLHPSGEPRGYLHGITKTLNPPREMTQASKMVKKAFPRVVDTQPYEVLFSTTGRILGPAPRAGNPTDEYAGTHP